MSSSHCSIKECLPEHLYRTPSFYLVFFIVVVPLWLTLPLSWYFIIHTLFSGNLIHNAIANRTVFFFTLSEVTFSLYYFHLSRRVAHPAPCPPGDPTEIQVAYSRVLKAGLAELPEEGHDEESDRPGSPEERIIQLDYDDPRAVDFRTCLRNWFHKAPLSSVRLHEVRKWLYWTIFNRDLQSFEILPESQNVILNWAIDLLQKRSGYVFQEGSNPDMQPMRITLDEIHLMWRPLTFYLIIIALNYCLKNWYINFRNTQFHDSDGLEFLVRVPAQWDTKNGSRPVVFIHGLGLGLVQYHRTIVRLLDALPDRPVLILLQPHISQNIFHPKYLEPMSRRHTTNRLARLLEKLGWVDDMGERSEETHRSIDSSVNTKQGVTIVSHSNGSYTHAWMLKGYPHMVGRSCFIDPVTFCSWEGDVCYNFIYRPCRTGLEMLMRYFVGSEIGVANLLQRHFDWTSNSLWFEDIPNARDPTKAFFVLGGKDSIISSDRVRRYLTSHGVKKGIFYDPTGSHGQALLPGSRGHTEVFKWLREDFKFDSI